MELNEKFISELPHSPEKVIDKYQKIISKEIKNNAEELGIQKARQLANIKYGKWWRTTLELKKIYTKDPFGRMSYY